jgi:hypothetical protein
VPFDIVHRTRVYVALVGKLSRNADDQGNEPVHVGGPIDPTVHVISSTVLPHCLLGKDKQCVDTAFCEIGKYNQ